MPKSICLYVNNFIFSFQESQNLLKGIKRYFDFSEFMPFISFTSISRKKSTTIKVKVKQIDNFI